MTGFESVMGLEVHAQLLTDSKIFCNCSTAFGAPPNTHTCPVCLGMPGVLPVLNKKVVDYAMKMALATHCRVSPFSRFARKNYFYPDLPKGYQISQYELPIAEHGYAEIGLNEQTKRIGITRIHMEEDAGKLIHDATAPISYVDFNRTGVPLIEIVSEPDIRTPEEAVEYLKILRNILRYLGICDGNMEEGSFRCDANVSMRPEGTETFGTRTEIKNMNSFRHVQKALEYEIRRQTALLLDGKEVIQETRLWDTTKGITVSMRGKEEAHDYRYFPDPDLVPLVIDEKWIEEVRARLPELPDAKQRRFVEEYGLPEYDAAVLTVSKSLADYFEDCVRLYQKPKAISNWMMSELLRELKRDEREIEECPVPPGHLAGMLKMMDNGVISGKIAKTVFEEMYATGRDPEAIVKEKGLVQVTDAAEIEKVVETILAAHPEAVEDYKKGKSKLLGFFVGEVMKKTKGKANPGLVNEILTGMLRK
ncbi:MAG: Asp-tRNA(Asn)/Glu-tRNA(Gln) amidotransferase subunit GatB [Thermodesulfobacteriota bacterium]|nr:Asp-tRNA(Asn)/Glu-tRNA(Gln) amidotransferase subunit GatB [Desulfovibrionales bacterium]MDQ7837037.1 Asp-tRNA(Asn)/Glu-tRNA(Gln) amidotransferase subunit GatB [Thermodesulfobacteriota bacterium]